MSSPPRPRRERPPPSRLAGRRRRCRPPTGPSAAVLVSWSLSLFVMLPTSWSASRSPDGGTTPRLIDTRHRGPPALTRPATTQTRLIIRIAYAPTEVAVADVGQSGRGGDSRALCRMHRAGIVGRPRPDSHGAQGGPDREVRPRGWRIREALHSPRVGTPAPRQHTVAVPP